MSPFEFESDENANLAHAGRGLIVDIGGNHAVLDLQDSSAAQRHVLADGANHAFQVIGDRCFRLRVSRGAELFDIAASLQCKLGDLANGRLEVGVARNEVGLAVDFDDRADLRGGGDADQPLGRHSARLYRGLGETFRAEPVNRGFHVATGFGQRGLAVHHARAGLVAEVLDHFGRDRSHLLTS